MFKDRKEAGKQLAEKLSFAKRTGSIVLGIPRGGIVVAKEVSRALDLPLDILVIKKIGHPNNPELAIGAASANDFYLNQEIIRENSISKEYIDAQIKEKQAQASEIFYELSGDKKNSSLKNKEVIVVDDGAATGTTMILALQVLKKQKPKKIIVALPVAHEEAIKKIKPLADEVVCLISSKSLSAIGEFYLNFEQVSTKEAKRILK